MNNRKQLLLAIFAAGFVGTVFTEDNVNTKEQQEQIGNFFYSYLYQRDADREYSAFNECIRTNSPDCALVIEHLKKAKDHRSKRLRISGLFYQMDNLDQQAQKPLRKLLSVAQDECPDCDHNYWATLPETEQDKLIQAAADIALGQKREHQVADNIDLLKKALNR